MKIPISLLTNIKDLKNMVVFTLTLIRHGETAHNKDDVIQGQLDVPLSETGLRQAELLGSYLQHQQFSHIYVSDLTRAMQTAECIIKQNKSFNETVLKDQRLRERKFGNIEGKSFEFLKEAARKSSKKVGQFTPPGGETIQQVHERAVSFFQDLCQMVKKKSNSLESQKDLLNLSSNGAGHSDNSNVVGQKRKRVSDSDNDQDLDAAPNRSTSKICNTEIDKGEEPDSLSSECCNSIDNSGLALFDGHQNVSFDDDKYVKQINSTKIESQNNKAQMSVPFTDDYIISKSRHSGNDVPNIECPNVSLSPLMDRNIMSSSSSLSNSTYNQSGRSDLQSERRLSVCSSCDDVDGCPTLAANVLVVSHGALIRELIRHFVEDLECPLPGGKRQALCISPNAGLSKFTVSVEPNGQAKIICLQIHEKQHLTPNLYNDRLLTIDDAAL